MNSLKTDTGNLSQSEQNITLKNRKELTVSGIEDVQSFDENLISVQTTNGLLKIKGTKLNIKKVSTETGELLVYGNIIGLIYSENEKTKGGFFGKIFK